MKAHLFIPAHAEATEDISNLAQYNIDAVSEVADKIISFCKTPLTFETLLQKLFYDYKPLKCALRKQSAALGADVIF